MYNFLNESEILLKNIQERINALNKITKTPQLAIFDI